MSVRRRWSCILFQCDVESRDRSRISWEAHLREQVQPAQNCTRLMPPSAKALETLRLSRDPGRHNGSLRADLFAHCPAGTSVPEQGTAAPCSFGICHRNVQQGRPSGSHIKQVSCRGIVETRRGWICSRLSATPDELDRVAGAGCWPLPSRPSEQFLQLRSRSTRRMFRTPSASKSPDTALAFD